MTLNLTDGVSLRMARRGPAPIVRPGTTVVFVPVAGPVLVDAADFDTATNTWPVRTAPRMFWLGGNDAHPPPVQPGDVWVRNS